MARPDPGRIATARHSATVERLVSNGVPRPDAEAWIAVFARRQPERRPDAAFWDDAYRFILGEVAARRRPSDQVRETSAGR